MRDLLTNKIDKTVYIRADARAKYSVVEDVVDNLRAAGVNEIGLITEEPHENKTPGAESAATPVRFVAGAHSAGRARKVKRKSGS